MELIVDFVIHREKVSNLKTYKSIEIVKIQDNTVSKDYNFVKIKILDLQEFFMEELHF